MRYRERLPPPSLASVVERIWTLEGDAGESGGPPQPVLPDGRPELVLHFGDPFQRIGEGIAERTGERTSERLPTPASEQRGERQAPILFAGQLSARLLLRPEGRIAVLGIRLRPHGAAALLPIPQRELAGPPLAVDLLDRRLARALLDLRDAAGTPTRAADGLEEVLGARVRAGRVDGRVGRAVEAILTSRGRIAVDVVARHAGMGARHLERRFGTEVGVGPKRLARIARFQHALRVLERSRGPAPGTRTAHHCGYSDQAHFVREFHGLAGCAPGAWLLERAELTGFFAGGGSGEPER